MSKNSITEIKPVVNLETVTGTGEILEDKSGTGKVRPWTERKMQNKQLVELYERAREIDDTILSDSRLDSLKDCASWLLFAENKEHERHLQKANFCRLRLCPMCNWRRSLKLFAQVDKIVNLIKLHKPTARYIFVTLTVRNCTGENLTDTINAMNKAFTYITSDNRTFAPAKKLKENLMGYMKAIEITYNSKSDTYHPHIHCIFELRSEYFAGRNYMNKKAWIELWKSAMKLDYEPSVDVRNIKGGTSAAVAEVAKYPVKLDILKIKDKEQATMALICLHKAIFKRRLVTFGGDFKKYKAELGLDDVEDGDLVNVDEQKQFNAVTQVLFKYRASVGAYIC